MKGKHEQIRVNKISDIEQCSNRLQLDLIVHLTHFTCELMQTMTSYDFLEAIKF